MIKVHFCHFFHNILYAGLICFLKSFIERFRKSNVFKSINFNISFIEKPYWSNIVFIHCVLDNILVDQNGQYLGQYECWLYLSNIGSINMKI